MSVEKWWNEICGRGKREKPREKKPTQTPFRPPRNPHGVTDTRTNNNNYTYVNDMESRTDVEDAFRYKIADYVRKTSGYDEMFWTVQPIPISIIQSYHNSAEKQESSSTL